MAGPAIVGVVKEVPGAKVSIEAVKPIIKPEEEAETGTYYGWAYTKYKNFIEYTQRATFAGSTITVTLPILMNMKINLQMIAQYFSAANARTFNIYIYPSQLYPDAYAILRSVSASVARSDVDNDVRNLIFLQASKLTFVYSSFTATDTVDIVVTMKLL